MSSQLGFAAFWLAVIVVDIINKRYFLMPISVGFFAYHAHKYWEARDE